MEVKEGIIRLEREGFITSDREKCANLLKKGRGEGTQMILCTIQDTYYRDILAHYSFSRSKYFHLLL